MSEPAIRNWQSVQAEVLRRITERTWKPGDIIPGETELAREFGCARATVNRALRNLAESGLLDRRRKAGTRVALHPVRKATLSIPIIRNEIEETGGSYRYALVSRTISEPPQNIRARFKTAPGTPLLHVVALHLADGRPYVFEDRWISLSAVPEAGEADFETLSPNEWLVVNVPFQGGDIAFSAVSASARDAELLGCPENTGLFVIDRTTWTSQTMITLVRLTFHPGYRMHTEL